MIQAMKLNKLEQGDGKRHVDTTGVTGEAAVKLAKSDPVASRLLKFK